MNNELVNYEVIDKDYKTLKILYFIRFFGDSFYYSFFQIFLVYKGLSKSNIGFILAIIPIMSLLSNPFWNLLSKDVNVSRRIMKYLTVIAGILFIIMGNLNTFETITVVTGLIAIIEAPFYSLLDGFSGTFSNVNKKNYPSIRIWGSIAYVVGCFIGGFVIQFFGYTIVFLIAGVFYLLSNLILSRIKPIQLELEENKKIKRDYKAVLTNKFFYLYILFYVFTLTFAAIGDSFYSVYLKDIKGLAPSMWGIVYSGMVLAEVIFMLLTNKYGYKFKDYQLFIIVGVSYVIRLLLIALNLPLPLVLFSAFFRGLAWGIVLSIHLKHLIKIVKIENITAAILILVLVAALIQAIGTSICGILIDNHGFSVVYFGLTIIVAVTTLINAVSTIVYNNKKK